MPDQIIPAGTPLPTPRLQLRWSAGLRHADRNEWDCYPEIVYPARTTGGPTWASLLAAAAPRTAGPNHVPCATSRGAYRFDAPLALQQYADWLAQQLGSLPVYVIAPNGTAIRRSE